MTASLALSSPVEALKLRAAKLWRAYPRETLGLGLLGIAVAAAIGGAAHSTADLSPAQGGAAPPAPPLLLLKQVAPDQALQINDAIPVASGPNPAAAPFLFKGNAAARGEA